jgi:hypothetical protein
LDNPSDRADDRGLIGEGRFAMHLFRSRAEKEQSAAAEEAFTHVVDALKTADPIEAQALVAQLESDPRVAHVDGKTRRKLSNEAFTTYAETVLADDHLTSDEEAAFDAVMRGLGLSDDDLQSHADLLTRIAVAGFNDGRLPTVASPQLMARRGEVVHMEVSAALLKEVAVREWQGGSQGVSFQVAKGVRYRVGATRGHLVTVGSQIQVADTGTLSITSMRAAYLGSQKTVEMPYAKLMGMKLYSDGIQFSLSNRQNAPLFRLAVSPHLVGALVNAAMQASLPA